MSRPIGFISYCHADETWKDRLVRHLEERLAASGSRG